MGKLTRKEYAMIKISKKLIVLLLGVIITMLVFVYIGVTGLLDNGKDGVISGGNSLGKGDWIYLDISSATNWTDGSAKTTFYYESSDSSWKALDMAAYSSTLYRVRIPDDMADSGQFKFFRGKDNTVANAWNWVPSGSTNLTLSGATSNTLCVTSSNFSSYSWKSTWTIVNNAGEDIFFLNMDGEAIDGFKVIFSVSDDASSTTELPMEQVSGMMGLYKVTIPDGADYDVGKFVDGAGNILATEEVMNGSYEPGGKNTYYYNATKTPDGNISFWGEYSSGTESIANKKLYLDMWNFSVDEGKTITIQTGDGEEGTFTPDADDLEVYSYTIPSSSGATQKTIITIKVDGKQYRMLWSQINKDTVTYTGTDILTISDAYYGASGLRKIYFDATLSKLSYVGDVGDIGMPLAGSDTIKYHAWSSTGAVSSTSGTMTKLDDRTIGKNTWKDVYMVELDSAYDMILFYSGSSTATNCTKTVDLNIPSDIKNPCFYADTSDDIAYKGGNRKGYWGQVYKIRNVEEGKVNSDIVDVSIETFDRDSHILYVNTTLYDYYSDYELNGNNRDNYDTSVATYTHRIYQPFRQFNQALSAYYKENKTDTALYWGNMQNYSGAHFKDIAGTLDLYGYDSSGTDLYKKFFYENNGMWGRDGNELANGYNATLNLTADKMSSGSLMLDAEGGSSTVIAPFFDEDFLTGNNSKNTILGEVYHNVSFPFVKKAIKVTDGGETVDYWYYDSADNSAANKNLRLKQATVNGKYYLASTDSVIKGTNASGVATSSGNYFPFNRSAQSGHAQSLNYGFGQKLEFTFRLTSDGTIVASGNSQVPIEFVFEGDDDVWVYIDGELILDIGGAHDKVKGTIDFQHRTSTVGSVKSTTSGIKGELEKDFPDSLKNDPDFYNKEHTLTMYYMERGLWESNMSIIFNFPDENKLTVEKEVDTSKVNELFKDLFYDKSIFNFNIRNQATHYGLQPVYTGNEAKPKIYNESFLSGTVEPSSDSNIFEYVDKYVGQTDVVKWFAKYDDVGGSYKDKRWGIIYPSTGKGTYLDVSEQCAYLQFKIYYSYTDTLQLKYARIELEDSNGNTIGGSLNGKTYGNSNVETKKWSTLQIDLREFDGYEDFDFSEVANIKFDYDYPREICLDDFVFKPAVNATTLMGFTMQQHQIPDYDSSNSGILENAVNALYSSTKGDGQIEYGRVDEEGHFVLAHGQKITFSNQFRRGSYIYLKENINEDVFDVTWKIYEDDEEVADSTVPNDSDVCQGGGPLTNTGTIVYDERLEKYDNSDDSEGYSIANSGYTSTGPAKIDKDTETTDTIVFRSYIFPDSEAVGIDLLVKQINTVKTGALTVEKRQATGSQTLTGKYTIRIEFTNVAGLGLETQAIVYEVQLAAGEKHTITGIPAGTIYTITEVLGADDLKLESIEKITDGSGNVIGNDDMHVLVDGVTKVQGSIQADDVEDETTATGFVFVNSLTPTINLNMEKLWKASDGITDVTEDLPESIWVQIQRKAMDEDVFLAVDIPGTINGCIELLPGYDGWLKQVIGLNKYKDNDVDNPYTYRVVEMQKLEDSTFTEVGTTFWYSGNEFKVGYGADVVLSSDNTAKEYAYTITNTAIDTFSISFTKIQGAGASIEKLLGAEFVLYEYKGSVELSTYSEIMENISNITQSSTSWVVHDLSETDAVFSKSGLSRESVYYLVETKVPTGMQSPNGCWKVKFVADNSDVTVHENVKITAIPIVTNGTMPAIGFLETAVNGVEGWFITNLEQWNVPATGGIGLTYPYIAGICLMLVAVVWGGVLYYRDRRRGKT